MSSETSTEAVRLGPDASTGRSRDLGLQPWQFFVLAALACATALTFLLRGQGLTVVILVSVLMATTAFVGIATLRMLRPLFAERDDRTAVVGHRTRAALEQEKLLSLRTIKDLEFDRAMGKISEEDFNDYYRLCMTGEDDGLFECLADYVDMEEYLVDCYGGQACF